MFLALVMCTSYVSLKNSAYNICCFLVFYIHAIEQLSHRAEVVVSLVLDNIVHLKTGVYKFLWLSVPNVYFRGVCVFITF